MIEDKVRDAERQALGACLVSPDVIDDVLAVITPADLYEPRHELILHAIEQLRREGTPADTLTVSDRLGKDLARAGGMTYLAELVSSVVAPSSASYYAETIIRPAALARRVVALGHRLVDSGSTGTGGDPLDVVNSARQELDELAVGTPEEASHETDVYAALDDLEQEAGIPTPWRDVNDATGGWMPGKFVLVGARPAVGKSVIGVGIALDMARRGRHAHIASLEMSKAELYHRMLANVASVPLERIVHRKLTDLDWRRLGEAAKHIADLPLSVDDRGTQRVSDIRARCRSIKRTRQLGVVVVDYLQLMRSGQRAESRQAEVSGFSRDLKLLAKELEVPVVALSQLNRGSESRTDRRPLLSDLRESGSLEQDADLVFLLHRDPDKPSELEMLLGKNRHGPADRLIRLEWEGSFSRATDYTPPTWAPPREKD